MANPNMHPHPGFCLNVKKHLHDNSVIYCYSASGLCCLVSLILCIVDVTTAKYSAIRIVAISIAYFALFPGILVMAIISRYGFFKPPRDLKPPFPELSLTIINLIPPVSTRLYMNYLNPGGGESAYLLMFFYTLLGFHLSAMSYLTQLGSYVCCVGTLGAITGLGADVKANLGFTSVSWVCVVVIIHVVSTLTLASAPPKTGAPEAPEGPPRTGPVIAAAEGPPRTSLEIGAA
ncbi:hypothetical protein M5689_012673 [Euphorbia peplus]|nr:hypothetical protein M5689_012673 [Euphorbia peplus]